jgi:hypothetical protein
MMQGNLLIKLKERETRINESHRVKGLSERIQTFLGRTWTPIEYFLGFVHRSI